VGKVFDVTRERIRQIEAKDYASFATRPLPAAEDYLERVEVMKISVL